MPPHLAAVIACLNPNCDAHTPYGWLGFWNVQRLIDREVQTGCGWLRGLAPVRPEKPAKIAKAGDG